MILLGYYFDVGDSFCALEHTLDVVHNLVNTPLEGCRYECVQRSLLALVLIMFFNLFDHSRVSPTCSQPSISPEYYIDEPISHPKICDSNVDFGHEVKMFNMLGGNVNNVLFLGCFCGYDASLDPYWKNHMENFVLSFDFSVAFALLKRALTFFAVIIFMLSYCHACESRAQELDKLLHLSLIHI